jgi:DNA-binding NarL/FixJ family response regulator
VICVDDHEITRRGFISLATEDDCIDVIGQAGDGNMGWNLIKLHQPDVAVLDIELGPHKTSGFEIARKIIIEDLKTEVVILTNYHLPEFFIEAVENLNVSGYVLKDDAASDLIEAIKRAHKGENFLSSKAQKFVLEYYKNHLAGQGINKLTERERVILLSLSDNLSNKQIGEKLFIEERTVETHRKNISEKLGLKGRNALLVYSIQNRFVLEMLTPTLSTNT